MIHPSSSLHSSTPPPILSPAFYPSDVAEILAELAEAKRLLEGLPGSNPVLIAAIAEMNELLAKYKALLPQQAPPGPSPVLI